MKSVDGIELQVDQRVSYPVRRGSYMYVRVGNIVEIRSQYVIVLVDNRWAATEPKKMIKVWRTDRMSVLAQQPTQLHINIGLTFPSAAVTFTQTHNAQMEFDEFQQAVNNWNREREEVQQNYAFNRLMGGA